MEENYLYIHNFLPETKVEGPGKRFTLWLQGCTIQCDDCMAKHTWQKTTGKKVLISELLKEVDKSTDIEGITILGGEPLDQSKSLFKFLVEAQKRKLSIMLFTGYLFENLTKEQKQVADLCDILIDGPYIKSQTDFSRLWVGSANQRILFLTDRYKHINVQNKEQDCVEIRISKTGEISLNGMFSEITLENILSK